MEVREIIKKAGGPSRLAKQLGITHTAVIRWKKIPPIRVITLEKLTGIPREELRPDIFGKEER